MRKIQNGQVCAVHGHAPEGSDREFFIHQKAGFDMDLFEYMREQQKETEAPLASRLRPTTLDEMVGQQHIIGKDKLLYRAIKADKISSLIFMVLLERERPHWRKLLQIQRVLISCR